MNDMTIEVCSSYISLGDLATRLNLPQPYLKQLIEAKELPYIDIGRGRMRFQESTVRDVLTKKELEQLKQHTGE